MRPPFAALLLPPLLLLFAPLVASRNVQLTLNAGVRPEKLKRTLNATGVAINVTIQPDFRQEYVYLEWFSHPPSLRAPVALLASNDTSPPEIRKTGAFEKPMHYNCTDELPCFLANYYDQESFFAAPGYAFLRVPPVTNGVLQVLLHYVPFLPSAAPTVNGTFVLRLGNATQCGGRKPGVECGGGKCNHGRCDCPENSAGKFCEEPIMSLEHGESTWEVPAGVKYLRYHFPSHLRGDGLRLVAKPLVSSSDVLIFAKEPYKWCRSQLTKVGKKSSYLPSRFDSRCQANVDQRGDTLVLTTRRPPPVWIVAIFAKKKVELSIDITVCSESEKNPCSPSTTKGKKDKARGISPFSLLILPICLSILCLAAAVVCVLLYVDRRHGFVTGPDKLTPKELNLMCPEFTYTGETDNSGSDDESPLCSICICDFETGEHLRKLQCNHRFHCECVDPWLTQANASCPTCRQEARVPELSERRFLRAIVKHVLAPLLRIPHRARLRRVTTGLSIRRSVSRSDLDAARAAAARARISDQAAEIDQQSDAPAVPQPVAFLPDRQVVRGSRRESSIASPPNRSPRQSSTEIRSASPTPSMQSVSSSMSFATAPLNIANHPLTFHGVLPHVRAALLPARRLPPPARSTRDSSDSSGA